MMAARITISVQEVVHRDQSGFLPGRAMATNTNFLIQAIDYYTNKNTEATIIMIDAEKAFDFVQWKILFTILSKFNFPLQFIIVLRTLYSKAEAKIIINSHTAGSLQIRRGTRQGCTLHYI